MTAAYIGLSYMLLPSLLLQAMSVSATKYNCTAVLGVQHFHLQAPTSFELRLVEAHLMSSSLFSSADLPSRLTASSFTWLTAS